MSLPGPCVGVSALSEHRDEGLISMRIGNFVPGAFLNVIIFHDTTVVAALWYSNVFLLILGEMVRDEDLGTLSNEKDGQFDLESKIDRFRSTGFKLVKIGRQQVCPHQNARTPLVPSRTLGNG